jgi:hypothetical protein
MVEIPIFVKTNIPSPLPRIASFAEGSVRAFDQKRKLAEFRRSKSPEPRSLKVKEAVIYIETLINNVPSKQSPLRIEQVGFDYQRLILKTVTGLRAKLAKFAGG